MPNNRRNCYVPQKEQTFFEKFLDRNSWALIIAIIGVIVVFNTLVNKVDRLERDVDKMQNDIYQIKNVQGVSTSK
jgi:hypothetical protein